MNAVKPLVLACTSRTRSRCSIRSARVSPMPYIMVTEVFIPSPWASSMISSQRSAPAFFFATKSRTRWTRISPPPPGIESRPAFWSSRITSTAGLRHPEGGREEIDVAGTEAVNVNRVVLLDVAEQIEIPLERDVGIVAALHQDLHRAERFRFLDLGADLLIGQRPSFAVLGPSIEGAEATIGDTDVGVVDVAVDDVGDDALGMLFPADGVGRRAELEERRIGVKVEIVFHRILSNTACPRSF